MGRKPSDPDYGLPPLTFAEAARVLDVDQGAFMNWVMKTAKPSMSQWSDWNSGRRTVPERLIRLYLTELRRDAEAVRASIQRSLRLRARDDEAERAKVIGTRTLREKAKPDPDEKRAAG